MNNFIYDDTTLPIDKINLAPLPAGANPRQWAVASEWITVLQALYDIQGWARAAQWHGFAAQATDPTPAGIADYLWIRNDGNLMKTINGVASVVGGGGGGGTVTSVGTGTGLTGGPITGSGTISLANTAVTPGSYTNVNLTVDAQGRITAASNGTPGISGIVVEYQPTTPTPPPAGTDFYDGVTTPDGAHVYVGNDNNDSRPVYVFRTSDNTWIASIPAGNGPTFLAITPDGSKVYASSYYSSDVTVIDTATNTVITTIPGFSTPQGIAITPDGTTAYVANFGGNNVIRIDVATNTIVGSPIATDSLPQYIRVNPAGTKVYVTCAAGATNSVHVISTASNTIIASIPTSSIAAARGLAVKNDSSEVYVGNANLNVVRRIDGVTDALVGPAIALTTNINAGLDINGAGTKVYVPQNNGSVDVISVATNLVTTNIVGVGTGLNGAYKNPVSTRMYVSNGGGSNVKVIDTTTDTVVATVTSYAAPSPVVVGTFQTFNFEGTKLTDAGGGVVRIAPAVVFDDATLGVHSNIRSNRDQQSAVNNATSGITNFGSQTGDWDPAATGAVGGFSTIGGGDDNSAGAIGFETVAGGAANKAQGDSATVGGGFQNQAIADYATVAGGTANQATGLYSAIGGGTGNQVIAASAGTISGGNANTVKADNAYAEGLQNTSQGQASHAEGRGNSANGNYAHAEGWGNNVNGQAAHAEGSGNACDGNEAHVEGSGSSASGAVSHAEGDDTLASGHASHSQGQNSTAQGDVSDAGGILSQATYTGQRAHGSGPGSTSGILSERGAIQHSVLTMAGKTPGVAAGETVELDFGLFGDVLRTDFLPGTEWAWTIVVTGVARSNIGPYMQSFRQMFAVRIEGNVPILVASGTLEKIGDGGSSSWTLVGSIGTSPDRFKLTFSTGTTTVAARVVAKVELVEVNFNAV